MTGRATDAVKSSSDSWPDKLAVASWLGLTLVVGLVLGLTLPTDPALPAGYDRISSLIGWTYFAAWSVSFYPQVYHNYRRKSVVGLSFDFLLLNVIGFVCYSIFNVALFTNTTARAEYIKRFGSTPAVQANDVFFALHAALFTAVAICQCFVYERQGQHLSRVCKAVSGAAVAIAVLYGLLAWNGAWQLSPLNFLYFLSYIKLGVTCTKYMPQVYINFRTKSTKGWNVWTSNLDLIGGALSIAQLLLDAAARHDISAVTGDPVKLLLGMASLVFDCIFLTQHYWLYAKSAQYMPLQQHASDAGDNVI